MTKHPLSSDSLPVLAVIELDNHSREVDMLDLLESILVWHRNVLGLRLRRVGWVVENIPGPRVVGIGDFRATRARCLSFGGHCKGGGKQKSRESHD